MIAIDFSLRSTGYCVFKGGELIKYGVITTDASELPFVRTKYLTDELLNIIVDNKVERVVIESPAFGARGSMEYVLKGSHFYLVSTLYNELGIECKQVAPTSIKKKFTGSGRASKKEMVDAMPEDTLSLFKKDYVMSRGLTDLVDAFALGWIQINVRDR